jgi:alginate O-acetyltransferase complex protein AlgJ
MSTLRQHISTLLLPTVVFGYAAYSNSMMLAARGARAEAQQIGTVSVSGMLDGEVTRDLDALYKKELPHRDASVGLAGNARFALLGTGRRGVVVGRQGWLFTNEEFKPVDRNDIADAVRHIAGVKARLDAKGIELVILPLPAKSDVYSSQLPNRLQSDVMQSAYAEFLPALRAVGLHVVDARGALLAQKKRGNVFLKSDTHWSPAGARAASEAAAAAIGSFGLLPEPRQVAVIPEPPVSIWGDLTKFITLPEYAASVGIEPESVALFRTKMQSTETKLDLFGADAAVPVMLVGTSYSANENWSFADYLRQSLSADVVNAAKEGLGPGVPMLELLDSDVLNSDPPKIIVWEFPVRYIGGANLWERNVTVGSSHHLGAPGGGNV